MKNNYKQKYDELYTYFNGILDKYYDNLKDIPEPLLSAMKYSVKSAGKRIRPVLALYSCELFCKDKSVADYLAIALETVHCYSLVHDDMPEMDNDTIRRGKPTVHVAYGQGMALLTGDSLLSQAYECLFNSFKKCKEISVLNDCYAEFASYIGSTGMVAGQCVDITANKDYSLEYIHLKKTSALLSCGLVCGAMLGGAKAEDITKLRTFGEKVGLAFQITDDILDLIGDSTKIGKSIGKDDAEGKITYPSVYGLEKSKEIARSLINEAIDCVSDMDEEGFLVGFAQSIINRQF